MNSFIMNLLLILMILLSLAFLTLLERKILGYIQIRKGPNKVGIMGIIQPFSDAIKLFTKELFLIKNSNYMFYLLSPVLSMMLMLMMWLMIPNYFNLYYLNLNLLLLLCFLSMGVYMMMISGWSSNSMYSMLGAIRSIAQTISYEVSLILIILSNLLFIESFNLMNMINYQYYINFIMYMYPMMLMFLVSIIAELNRTPFDLAEGESELVSGFNTEYMSGGFALIFMAEYGMIILMSTLFVFFYLGNFSWKFLFFIKILMLMNIIIIFRGSYPRYRYDKLMMLIWKSFLPIILNLMMYLYLIKWIMIIMMPNNF
uniref:NADH dehydrogenase subunit 1 n=1 Tax=Andricus mairei TaxID=1100877 RepID=UPI00226CBECB|nr:NADH dehydrogenase subunit 1 [Andricus mairei]UZI00030.1 NADH dehydrogenase subunit 1 [Andricus mairei]